MAIEAYNVRNKKKEAMKDVVIDINDAGRYFAKGMSKDGKTKMSVVMGKDKAIAAVKAGEAKKGTGW